MELRQKCARLAIAGLAVAGLVVVASPADKAFGWTSTAGSVSVFLGTGQVAPKAVEVDSSGNIYTAGAINKSTDFDPSPSTTYTLSPTVSNNYAGFITKMNSNGELLWAGIVTGSGTSRISDLSIDSSGNVLVLGYFSGTVDLDPGAGTTSVQSSSSGAQTNLFTIRLTTAGTLSWSHTLPVLSYGYSIDVDSSDNFVMTGEYAGNNIDFDPGVGTALMSNGGSNGVFVWSVTSTGTHRWVKRATGTYTNSQAVATDSSGNVYVCGTYQGNTNDFDPGAGTANQSSTSGSQDFYLWSLDQDGNYRWVTTFGNSNPEGCSALDVSPTGNVLVSGSFYTSIDLGRDASDEITAISGEDFFYGMFNSNGINQWIYARDSVSTWGLGFSGTSAWIVGSFFGTVDFNPDPAVTNNLVSRGSSDAYVVELNTSGVYQSAFNFGGSGQEFLESIKIVNGEVYLAGYFSSTPGNFNAGNGTAVNVNATGTWSGYVNKLTSNGAVVVPTTTTTTTSTTVAPTSTSSPAVTTTVSAGTSSTTTTTVAGGSQGSTGNGPSSATTSTTGPPTNRGESPTTTIASTTTTVQSEIPDIASVDSGEVGATVDGKPAVVTLSDDNGAVVATVGDATISYSVTAPDGSRRAVSVESFSVVLPGDMITLTFAGFRSSGTARAWIAPPGLSLGEVALENGGGTVQGTVPDNLNNGNIRVVTVAESTDSVPVVVAYGVKVEEKSSSGTPWSWVLIIVVGLAVAGGLMLPAAKRRKQGS